MVNRHSSFLKVTFLPLICLCLAACDKDKLTLDGNKEPIFETTLTQSLQKASVKPILGTPQPVDSWGQAERTLTHNSGSMKWGAFLQRPKIEKVALGESGISDYTPRPIIAKGVLYYLNHQGVVSAISLKTKNVLWRKEFLPASKKGENILGGGLAFSNGKLYVTAPYGLLVALDAQTGQEKWRKSFSSLLRVSPIAAGQALFVVTFDNQLYALSQKDGTVHWMHLGIPEPMQFMRMAGASVEGDRVVVAYSSGEVLALNRETGTVLWKSSIPETAAWYMPRQKAIRFASAPLIYRGKVFVGTLQSGLTAFDLKTGDKLWQAHFPLTEPCLATGNMLISVTAKGTLLSLHTENGRLFWEKDLKGFLVKAGLKFDDLEDDEQEKVFTGWLAPRLINGQLYCAHELGFLAILDPQTGRLRMITKHDFTGHAFPIFASGVLHILDQEEELFSFQLTSALSGFSSMPTKS